VSGDGPLKRLTTAGVLFVAALAAVVS